MSKPRVRPLSNLYHRWGRALSLDSSDVGAALWEAKVIEYLPPNEGETSVTHYRETARFSNLSTAKYEEMINEILTTYRSNGNRSNGNE
jgi:hypothetical protein